MEQNTVRREATSEQRTHNKTVQKRDTPRKHSEPIRSSVHLPPAAAASISCPAGFTIPPESDPVRSYLRLLLLLLIIITPVHANVAQLKCLKDSWVYEINTLLLN